MSMTCSILGLTLAQINGLAARPALVSDLVFVAGDETRRAHADEIMRRMPPEQRRQVESSSAPDDRAPAAKKLQIRVAEARERIAPLGSFEPPLALEKWWHVLHYLLT